VSTTRSRFAVAALAVIALAAAGCPPPAPRINESTSHAPRRAVRVGLAVRVPSLTVRTQGSWEAVAGDRRLSLAPGSVLQCRALADQVVCGSGDGREVTDRSVVRLEPRGDDAALLIGDARYRGRFEMRSDAGGLTLVESIDVEEYLRGVVPWEIGRLGPEALAAVEAQAVAARTYTLTRLGQFETFDLLADERDQVYKGVGTEDPVADRAIEATRGMVLESHGQLAQAYYSSTCGGYTSWIEHVWPKPAAEYLRGRRDANGSDRSWCTPSRHFRWSEAWSGAELERTFRNTLPRTLQLGANRPVGSLLDVRVAERDASARVLDLEVTTTTEKFHVRGDTIRWALKPRDRALLRSLMFELEVEREQGAIVRVVARGGGNGHGVGMCQMGAIAMARAGHDVQSILAHYYEGTTLRRAY
jgi:stage II sporulation protein D